MDCLSPSHRSGILAMIPDIQSPLTRSAFRGAFDRTADALTLSLEDTITAAFIATIEQATDHYGEAGLTLAIERFNAAMRWKAAKLGVGR